MKFAHLATRLYNCPLLITPEKADAIEAVFRARVEGRAALESPAADPQISRQEANAIELAAQGLQRADAGYWRTADGIALIPVIGSLVQRADSMDAMSGLVGYNRIAGQLQAALDDPRVDAILLEIDSPGGEVNGLADLTAKIAAAATKKPLWAIANEGAFSAAYWMATAASKLYVPQTGMVGSIGVYMMHQDQSAKDAKAGVTYTPIQAGAHKTDMNPHAPLSDAGRAVAQARVDEIYAMFVSTVAENRGIAEQTVRDTEAGILNTKAALDIGLIDGVASFDETLAALADEAKRVRNYGMRAAANARAQHVGDAMADADSLQTGVSAMPTPEQTAATAAQLAEAEERGRKAAEVAAKAEADAKALAAAKAAQERIAGIIGHAEAKERRALAEHIAFKTAMPLDEAAAMLTASPKETAAAANPLAAAMAREKNPNVGADVDPDVTKAKAPVASVVYAFRRECVAKARAGR